jgi:hypothetical protein
MSDLTLLGGGEQPPVRDEHHAERKGASKAAATAMTTLAGALAGTAAGLNTMIVGPAGTIVGALVGAELAGLGSEVVVTEDAAYELEHDEHYRALWESDPGRQADAAFETARPAYRFGHVAAYHEAFVGRDFVAAEADLRTLWERDFAARYGRWEGVREYVCDAYGHSRGSNFGIRRDRGVVGTGGSAVDPLELERARAGLASRPESPEGDEPLFPIDLAATAPDAIGARSPEDEEVPQREVRHDQANWH